MAAGRDAASTNPLLSWIRRALQREDHPWSEEQRSFLESVLATEEGSRALAALVATTLRLRGTSLKPDLKGPLATILPSIEAFWNDPNRQTYQELRVARW
jgi:hypothetical protein